MPNYDERQDLRADEYNQVMSEQRYKQLDQQIEADMIRSEYSAMSQLSDSKEDAIRDALRERNQRFLLNEQLRKQRLAHKIKSVLFDMAIILSVLVIAYFIYSTFFGVSYA